MTAPDTSALLLDERPRADERLQHAKALAAERRWPELLDALRVAVRAGQEGAVLRRLAVLAGELPSDALRWRRKVRIAILSSTTVADRAALLKLFLRVERIDAEVYEAHFGAIESEIMDGESELYRFRPEVTIVAPSAFDAELASSVEGELQRWKPLWTQLLARTAGRVLHHGYVVPTEPALGNLDLAIGASRGRLLRQLNLALADGAPSGVSILDVDAVASAFGKLKWTDPRFWALSKEATSADARPSLAQAEAAVVRGFLGLSKKVLAVDLDNTLWGGVIGEDGLENLEIAGTPTGEAFVTFQHYLKELRQRGVVLVAVSKNNDEDARKPFLEHPEMVLKLEDFASFHANWRPKSQNLVELAEELALGIDSFLFVDDNPGERAEVRIAVPDVEVVTLPADPALYVRAVAAGRWFEVPALTDEDLRRADDYRAAAEARELERSSGSFEDFLGNLELVGEVRPFDPVNLPRIAQLIQRSNQYNLTTRRYTEADVKALMEAPGVHTRFVRLRDRFGDRGLISLVVAREEDHVLELDTWIMSCRVLNRTVEHLLVAELSKLALAAGKTRLRGRFIPSPKNSLVKDHYERLGFTRVAEEADGSSTWERDATVPAPRSWVRVAP